MVDAIRVASSLKEQGAYDWFRGQFQNWPLRSSFVRLGKGREEKQRALERARRFIGWAKSTSGLETLVKDVDATSAVAQHYGIPTNYIDFTTSPEIAGFFAADNPHGHPATGESCILCLNTGDLKRFWANMPPDYPTPEFIEVRVPNLWRLEAQRGRFLFCAYDNFEHIYDLDRIVFPYTGPVGSVRRDRIYPQEKSALEILLDQFFMNERLIAGTAAVRTLPWAQEFAMEDRGGWDSDLIPNAIPILDSWRIDLRPWLDSSEELYSEISKGLVVAVDNELTLSPLEAGASLKAKLILLLGHDPKVRMRSLTWLVPGPHETQQHRSRLAGALRRLWDGIRILPFDTEQVADSVGQCVALWRAGASERDFTAMGRAASLCFGDSIELEFGASDGAYSRGFGSKEALLNAVRKDISKYLNPTYQEVIRNNAVGLLQAIQDPSQLFEFSLLADVFVRQLAPCQVLYREASDAIFFSPARLNRFGLL